MLGIFLDTETNGLNFHKHRIIEIAYKIIDLYTGDLKEKYQSIIYQPPEIWEKSDLNSLEINGFTWEEVAKGKKEKNVSQHVLNSFGHHQIKRENAVYICQNPSFDRAFFSQLIDPDTQETLNWPYHWLDLASMYWATCFPKAKNNHGPFPWETGFSKDLIASSSNLPTEGKPHRAMNGVNHLILCYESLVGFPHSKDIAKKISKAAS